MNGPAAIVVTVLVIGALLGAAWVLYFHQSKAPTVEKLPPVVPPKVKADPKLASLVWAAHVANQQHDLAVLTGTPEEVAATRGDAIDASSALETYLIARRRRNRTETDDV